MKESATEWIAQLRLQTQQMIQDVKHFNTLSTPQLTTPPAPGKWNVLECIAHINLYSDFYLSELEHQILNAKHPAEQYHKSSWMGKYSYQNMLPQNNQIPKPMNTFKKMNPSFTQVSHREITRFLKQQTQLLTLLDQAEHVSLRKTKCRLTLPLLKFNLGDTLRFYVYHNMRHIWQAQQVVVKISEE